MMGFMHKTQKGISMVEVLVAVAVTGIMAVLIGVIAPQMTSIPEKGGAQMDALHDLQNAIHWIGMDAGSAQTAVGGSSLTLTMPDDSVITYTRTGDTLYRNILDENQPVARSISALNITVIDRMITLEITAAPDNRWGLIESRTYQVAMRPSGT
jgi:type II secretory pathway pseudopilin PulG